jgi:hypothetical protein
MKEDKNLEQNLDKSNKKLHISDVMKCNIIESCLECVYCKLNPYGKSDDEDYTGYHCTWIGKKICDEKDLTEISRIPEWCRKYYVS